MSCQHESHQRPVAPTSKPLPESLQWLEDDLGTIKSNDLFRPVRTRLGRQDGTVILNDRELINFGSNDYLGYAGDSRLIKASAKGACSEGAGGLRSVNVDLDVFYCDQLQRSDLSVR